MINITISGAGGRMGTRITALAAQDPEIKICGAIESMSYTKLGKDLGEVAGIEKLGVLITSDDSKSIESSDVLVEFTNPSATISHLEVAMKYHKSVVIGTTGFSDEQLLRIKSIANEIPIVLSPNMSVGANLLFKLCAEIAKTLGNEYDIEIIEAHHNKKKDAPSGTAIKLADSIASALNRNLSDVAIYGRKGLVGERTRKEIGIHSIRAGDIVGEHTIIFAGLGERIEVSHKVSTRDAFAMGTIKAIKFVAKAKPGLYNMQDVLFA